MIGGGLSQMEAQFKNIKIDEGNGEVIEKPDLADVVYHIFRCNLAHGKSIPLAYKLLPVGDGYSKWLIGDGILKMPERIIWALLAVSVFCKANSGSQEGENYWLSWGSEILGLGIEKFSVKEWWGKEDDFRLFLSKKNTNPISIKIEELDKLNSNSRKSRKK
jgi:hypothetical protein